MPLHFNEKNRAGSREFNLEALRKLMDGFTFHGKFAGQSTDF